MLENLIKLVKEYAGDAIVKNPAVPNQHNDSAIETVAGSIFKSIKSAMGSGGLSQITNIFNGSDPNASQAVAKGATDNAVKNLMKKYKIPEAQAREIAAKVVPDVMTNLIKKTNDPNDNSFDLGSIVKSLSAGGGILNLLKGFFGGKK